MRSVIRGLNNINSILKRFYNSNITLFFFFAVILLEFSALFRIDACLHLYFLDVGQGDSILIKTPDYRYILVDGGEDRVILEELGEVLPFWQERIELVIGTHADSDHIGGLVFVLEKYVIGEFLTNDLEVEDSNLKKIKDLAVRNGFPTGELNSGNFIKVGDLEIEILWPDQDFVSSDDNQNSIVLRGEFGMFSFLLTGDIESEQEHLLISQYPHAGAIIMKASHHGSKTATCTEFVESVSPEYIVVSSGKDNKFGHPSDEVIERIVAENIDILRTDLSGRIEFVSDGKKFRKRLEK